MSRFPLSLLIALTMCLPLALLPAQERGKGGAKAGGGRPGGGKPPGGAWDNNHAHGGSGLPGPGALGGGRTGGAEHGGLTDRAGTNGKPQALSGAQGAAAANRANHKTTENGSAAAGAAAANRRQPNASGAEGVAAGAAAENRRQPNASGAEGAAVGVAAANRNAPHATGAQGVAAGYAAVRNSFNRPDFYNQAWYVNHRNAWAPTAWTTGTAWTPTPWNAVARYCQYGSTPVSYNYGTNVVCQGNNVVVDGQTVGTVEEFSQQASDLAQIGTDAKVTSEQWLPLGVFAMVKHTDDHPQLIVQLAVNKEGILRGNYTDEATDHTVPIHGSVDNTTQRAAWTVGENKSVVIETGLSNLTAGEAPALLHKNGKTERWALVRLEQPDAAGSTPVAP